MICDQCHGEGQTSKIYDNGTATTLLAPSHFYDEEGQEHLHDPNTRKTLYSCSNGHSFTVESKVPCPSCGPESDYAQHNVDRPRYDPERS